MQIYTIIFGIVLFSIRTKDVAGSNYGGLGLFPYPYVIQYDVNQYIPLAGHPVRSEEIPFYYHHSKEDYDESNEYDGSHEDDTKKTKILAPTVTSSPKDSKVPNSSEAPNSSESPSSSESPNSSEAPNSSEVLNSSESSTLSESPAIDDIATESASDSSSDIDASTVTDITDDENDENISMNQLESMAVDNQTKSTNSSLDESVGSADASDNKTARNSLHGVLNSNYPTLITLPTVLLQYNLQNEVGQFNSVHANELSVKQELNIADDTNYEYDDLQAIAHLSYGRDGLQVVGINLSQPVTAV